jgi:response regulator of citrate/malate metabolism
VIRTLIVEDDFRVARVHAEFAARVPGFEVVATVHTASAALSAVDAHRPDLLLLDIYLPDASGLKVLRRVRSHAQPPDVIMLTAASDMATVRSAMRGGALHYIVKPFDFETLRDRLERYAELEARRAVEGDISQQEVDHLFGLMRRGGTRAVALPKGHSAATAELVLRALGEAGCALSAAELSERIGISRATAQRYLSVLAEDGRVQLTLRYGSTGRPEHRYEVEATQGHR